MAPVPEEHESEFTSNLAEVLATVPRDLESLRIKAALSPSRFEYFVAAQVDKFGDFVATHTQVGAAGALRFEKVFNELIVNCPSENESVEIQARLAREFNVTTTRIGQMMDRWAYYNTVFEMERWLSG